MCDVLLINPLSLTPSFTEFTMPLGLGYIASCLEKEGMEVKVLDFNVEKFNKNNFIHFLENETPKLVGISLTSLSLPFSLEIASIIKKTIDAKICIGGPHVNADPIFIYKFQNFFDYQIVGEGELTFTQLAKQVVKGIALKSKSYIGKPIKNLNKLPLPAIHLFPIEKYEKNKVNIITSRGCPFNCTFCHKLSTRVRFKSPSKVLEEIKYFTETYSVNEVEFVDDNFTLNKQHVQSICGLIRKEKIDIKWSCQTRCNLIDTSLLSSMKKAGCYLIGYGVESFSQRLLKEIRKEISISQIYRAIFLTKKVGIKTEIFLLLGIPTEKKSDLIKNLQHLTKIDPDYILLSFLTVYPKTQMFDKLVKRKRIENNVWDKYALKLRMPPILLSEIEPRWYLSYILRVVSHFKNKLQRRKFMFTIPSIKMFPEIFPLFFLRRVNFRNNLLYFWICLKKHKLV